MCAVCGYVVVSLRQLERQLEREKEKSSTELTATQAVHQDELERLTKQLQTLQADNNLLMVCGFKCAVVVRHTLLPSQFHLFVCASVTLVILAKNNSICRNTVTVTANSCTTTG